MLQTHTTKNKQTRSLTWRGRQQLVWELTDCHENT